MPKKIYNRYERDVETGTYFNIIVFNHIGAVKGKIKISLDDEGFCKKHTWGIATVTGGIKYAYRKSKSDDHIVYMHRLLSDAKSGDHIDHINGDSLDNRRFNLRSCSPGNNLRNQRAKESGSSKFHGVTWYKALQKWRVQTLDINTGKNRHIGYFEDERRAALAYNKAVLEAGNEFSSLNEIMEEDLES